MSAAMPADHPPSRWLTLAGLAAISILLLYPAPTALTTVFSIPLLILLAIGLRPPPKWGGWVAATLIPYFAGALGEALAAPNGRAVAWAITALCVVSFLAAFYLVRRTGVSLRR